jgi:hypothetical protein
MFVGTEMQIPVSFPVAWVRLGDLAAGGRLGRLSGDTYRGQAESLIRVGPMGSMPGVSRLVAVRFLKLAMHGDSAVLVLRWEAEGPGGRLFPAFDADITLAPDSEGRTRLTLAGVYRPPLGSMGHGLDQVLLRKVAMATVRDFAHRVAAAIVAPDGYGTPGRVSEAVPA